MEQSIGDTRKMYCHLCAAAKPGELQVDLMADTEKKAEIIQKLSRINATIEFLNGTELPTTVCLECLSSLTKAYDFVISVENAQNVLHDIFNQQIVKIEVMSEGEVAETYEVPINSQSNSEEEEGTSNSLETRKENKKNMLELPLAQQKQTWVEFAWHCGYCDLTFPHVSDLQMHSMFLHDSCNAYRCSDCHFQSGILDKFLSHIKKHHLLLPYSCYKCYEKFITIKEVRKHEIEHIEKEHCCQGCNTSFLSSQLLSEHQEKYYKLNSKRKEYKCDICSKILKGPKGLLVHKLLHTEREPSYKCEVCGKGFYERYKLARHGITHSDNRPYKCDRCDTCFKTNQQLQKHITIHSDEKPFACDICGQRFKHTNLLSAHKKVHTDLKLNQCPVCNKCFKYRRAMNVHIGTHKQLNEYILPIDSVEVTINEEAPTV